jgi:hypothetical protein
VESWCPRTDYTIGTGHLLRQIDLRCGPEELSLETPVLLSCPAELPEARRHWLRRIALQTQSQWPLVRLRQGEPTGALRAEVDLRGAPAGALRCLISVGLASLRGAVASLTEAAELLADTAVVSEALALCSPHLTKTPT